MLYSKYCKIHKIKYSGLMCPKCNPHIYGSHVPGSFNDIIKHTKKTKVKGGKKR